MRVKVISEYKVYIVEAETMSEIKRMILDGFDVSGFVFCFDGQEDEPLTFNRFFEGVKADKR